VKEVGISLSIGGAVASIIIDRQEKRNAMPLRSWLALPSLIASAEREAAVKLIVLRGAGGNFGAGNDISEFGALRGDPAAATVFGRAMADAMQAVEAASKPVIVVIEGQCYGASVALALAGDLRIAGDNATFAVTPAKLGALYLQTDLHRLVATIGAGQSKKLIYTAQPISAARAQEIGLVEEVFAADQFEAELNRLIETIVAGSSFTLCHSKNMLRSVAPTPQETAASLSLFVAATQGDDFAEGIDAFLAKRAPQFG
jgi:enoyl-CoA hydratase/carnithine racemase